MISLTQNLMAHSRGWTSGANILPSDFVKRTLGVFFITLLLFTVSGCFMMFFPMAPLLNRKEEPDANAGVNAALSQLIQEGVHELAANRGPYEQILIGEASIRGDFILPEKFRQTLLETLRSSSNFQVFAQNKPTESAPIETEAIGVIAVLDAQLYKAGDQFWLALQLVDLRSNRIFWSGIFSDPMSKASDYIEEIDTSLTMVSK